MQGDDWNSWSLYLIKSIESLQERADSLEEEMHSINLEFQTELTKLRVYSKFASAFYSLISAVLISVIAGVITFYVTEKDNNKNADVPVKMEQKK